MLVQKLITTRLNAFLQLTFFFCLNCLSTSAFGVDLPNGGVFEAEISVSGEIDEYTFTANPGESVILRVADTETTEFINSAFFPRIELFDPNGSFVAAGQGGLVGSIFERLIISGEYIVRVFDNSSFNDETGNYELYFAKAPGADEGGELPNGEVVSETIDLGDIDTYTFQANAGESIALRVADTETTQFISSGFFPE